MKRNRNSLVAAMNKRHASGRPMKNRRDKRKNNPKKSWRQDEDV
jgi:hypothetical protein